MRTTVDFLPHLTPHGEKSGNSQAGKQKLLGRSLLLYGMQLVLLMPIPGASYSKETQNSLSEVYWVPTNGSPLKQRGI